MASWSQPACRLTLDLIQTIKMFKHVALILAVALNKGLKLDGKKSMILMNILRGPRVYVKIVILSTTIRLALALV